MLILYRNSMDFSEHFNQEELSDVVLRLVSGEAAEDLLSGSRKRARSAEPEETETRLLFLHKLALYASPTSGRDFSAGIPLHWRWPQLPETAHTSKGRAPQPLLDPSLWSTLRRASWRQW